MVIKGHPVVEREGRLLTVCAACERVRTVLFLSKDRWFCTGCRNEGDARPTMVPMGGPK